MQTKKNTDERFIQQREKKKQREKSKKETPFPSFSGECLTHQKKNSSSKIKLNLKKLFVMHGQKQILHGTKKTDGRRAELLRQIKTSQTLARIKHKHKMDSKTFYIFYIKNLIRFEKRCSFSKDAAFPHRPMQIPELIAAKFEEEKKRASFFFLLLSS